MSKTFSLNPRKPLSEEDARKIEEAIAAKGEGIAGSEPVSSEAREPVSSRAHEPMSLESDAVRASTIERPDSTGDKPPLQEPKNSPRPRTPSGKRVREVPVTGVGTLHNPRVRKADGVGDGARPELFQRPDQDAGFGRVNHQRRLHRLGHPRGDG